MRKIGVAAICPFIVLVSLCTSVPPPATPTPSASPVPLPTAAPPELDLPLPEGVLLVKRERTSGAFAVSDRFTKEIPGYHFVPSPKGDVVAFVDGIPGSPPKAVGIVTAGGEVPFREEITWETAPSQAGYLFPYFVWSNDGSRLSFTLPDVNKQNENFLLTVNSDGSDAQKVPGLSGQAFPVGWTGAHELLVHDGERLLLVGGVSSRNLELPEEGRSIENAQLSPDGLQVAVQMGYDEIGENYTIPHYTGLWVTPLDGPISWRRVADLSVPPADAGDSSVSAVAPIHHAQSPQALNAQLITPDLAWSPDGHKLVYVWSWSEEYPSPVGTLQLWVADLSNNESAHLVDGYSTSFSWSPDGRTMAFLRQTGGSAKYLTLLLPDGSVRETDEPVEQSDGAAMEH